MSFDLQLSETDKKNLIATARISIQSEFVRQKAEYPVLSENANGKFGAFVTLHLNGKLRGCIGYIRSEYILQKTIIDAARSAAFSDYRFSPLTESEFQAIDIEISVLSPFRKINSIDAIIPGTHGIYMSKGFKSGILLPQVATEYSWNRKEFLSQTCRKAGLAKDAWKDPDCKIEIFSALIFP